MKKIPCLYVMDYSVRPPIRTEQVTPGCEWVLAGEGKATMKYDGTACWFHGGAWYERYDAKAGKTPPEGAIPCDVPDAVTGHWPHWVLSGDKSQLRKALADALVYDKGPFVEDATYELCGPKVQSNPHKFGPHMLVRHGITSTMGLYSIEPKTLEEMKTVMSLPEFAYEGLVFHHPDGRMCKIRRDHVGIAKFGVK